jgi:hypothetical protein
MMFYLIGRHHAKIENLAKIPLPDHSYRFDLEIIGQNHIPLREEIKE